MENSAAAENQNPHYGLWSLGAFLALFFARTLPLLKAQFSSYGSDYGFYLYAAKRLTGFSWENLMATIRGQYESPWFLLGRLIHLPPSVILNTSLLVFALFLGLCIYWYFSSFSKTAGIIGIFLAGASLIQAEGYNLFLWKSLAVLPFLVLSFKFAREEKWWDLTAVSVIILATNRAAALPYFSALAIYFIYRHLRSRSYKILLLEIVLAAFFLPLGYKFFSLQNLTEKLAAAGLFETTGPFLENQNLLAVWWPMLILGAIGLFYYLKNKNHALPVFFFLFCAVWYALRLPAYSQALVYLDLCLILFAAYFLGQLNLKPLPIKLLFAGLIFFLAALAGVYIFHKQPLISEKQIEEIKNFSQKEGQVLSVAPSDAPWLLGYLNEEYQLAAPGLFEDAHTEQAWQDFWIGKNQINFIAPYPRPLYFYQRSRTLTGPLAKCLEPISENFSKYTAQCKP